LRHMPKFAAAISLNFKDKVAPAQRFRAEWSNNSITSCEHL
jgi:hypothetical protein